MKFQLNEILKRWINMIDIATKRVSFRSTKILLHLMAWKYDDIAMQMIIGLPHGEYKPASSLLPLTIDWLIHGGSIAGKPTMKFLPEPVNFEFPCAKHFIVLARSPWNINPLWPLCKSLFTTPKDSCPLRLSLEPNRWWIWTHGGISKMRNPKPLLKSLQLESGIYDPG